MERHEERAAGISTAGADAVAVGIGDVVVVSSQLRLTMSKSANELVVLMLVRSAAMRNDESFMLRKGAEQMLSLGTAIGLPDCDLLLLLLLLLFR